MQQKRGEINAKLLPEESIPDRLENQSAREFLKNAPSKGLWLPMGIEVKVMQCWRCKAYGHRAGDRECPLSIGGNLILDAERQAREDPMAKYVASNVEFGINEVIPGTFSLNFDAKKTKKKAKRARLAKLLREIKREVKKERKQKKHNSKKKRKRKRSVSSEIETNALTRTSRSSSFSSDWRECRTTQSREPKQRRARHDPRNQRRRFSRTPSRSRSAPRSRYKIDFSARKQSRSVAEKHSR
ncbi:unnamed protein product [Albugo candida]|uniref:Zinc knuckle domain-containing protein n=1 Tax=Albugo candida TaxID=65357 RepID=A0A024G3S4_9STRA|nr:unnamed protein product [Albugo candida]|eukprot:CCI41227.1 unnamed protein product [Albugo candida]